MANLEAGKPLAIPALPEAARAGSVRRTLLVSDQPGLVRMAAGLNFLLGYPYGCTEQRIALARTQVALRKFRVLLKQEGNEAELDRAVRDTLAWIPQNLDANGLVSFWPGSEGYVSLTAWTVQFLLEARDGGYPVDEKLLANLLRTLEQAMRSDYSRFLDGASFEERAWALIALTQAGRFQSAYAAELARKAQFLRLESVAEVLRAFALNDQGSSSTANELADALWKGIVTRLHQGREIFGGLQENAGPGIARILPSETRTISEMTRALVRAGGSRPRLQVLVDALVTLGRDDGWGTTNANAAALLALAEVLQPPFAGSIPAKVSLRLGAASESLTIGPDAPVATLVSTDGGAGEVLLAAGASAAVVARVESSYIPAADGTHVEPISAGFVVSREAMRQPGEGRPAVRTVLDKAALTLPYTVGDVIEEHVQVVNPADRFYVAIVVPLAAGMEPLNPNLATAPPEAKPSGQLTMPPTYVGFLDDSVSFYYNALPKGTYDFYFRTRAQVPGSFIQPPALAELMYDGAVRGIGAGARVEVSTRP
jgi:uncharacterized protein YfaS (alpha-2-macroglobulin family)